MLQENQYLEDICLNVESLIVIDSSNGDKTT